MARSTAEGRSVVGQRKAHSSRHRSSAKRRHKARSVEDEAGQPDLHELRKRREAYYTRSSLRGSQHALSSASKVHGHSSRSSKSKSKDEDKQKTVDHKTRSKKAAGKRPDRTAEYVYGIGTPGEAILEESDREKPTGSRSSRIHRSGASGSAQDDDASSPSVPAIEVTPDDSISQVGARSARRRPLRSSLRTIPEKQETSTVAAKDKRSSIFGSIFGRKASVVAAAPTQVECLTCGADDVPSTKAPQLECGHRMCHSCLKRIFKLAVHDPAHMPPKCCTDKHIPLKLVDSLFDLKFKVTFNKKFDEYRTRDRVYCPNRKCGIWIRPAYFHTSGGRRYAQCNKCKTKACLLCNRKLHRSSECPKDPEIAKLVAQAEDEGWRRCYSCKAMVELESGCNHMTCRCLAEFCMVCGAKWKTCDCPWFNTPAEQQAGDPFQNLLRDIMQPHRNADALDDLLQGVFGHAVPPRPRPRPRAPPPRVGYREMMDHRRRQQQQDEGLARRMQVLDVDDEPLPPAPRLSNTSGFGNAADHFQNDDFVHINTNVRAERLGDPAMAHRGERASGRRKLPRIHQRLDSGLILDFPGDRSVFRSRLDMNDDL